MPRLHVCRMLDGSQLEAGHEGVSDTWALFFTVPAVAWTMASPYVRRTGARYARAVTIRDKLPLAWR